MTWEVPLDAASYDGVGSASQLCEKFHQVGTDDSRDLQGSVHETLQCTDCHFQKGSEMSLTTANACYRCHLARPGQHGDVTKLDTSYSNPNSAHNIHFLTCKTCHK